MALPAFEPPALIAQGSRDPILTTSRARWLTATLPRARLAVVEGAGHFLQEDRPREVADLLSSFLSDDPQG